MLTVSESTIKRRHRISEVKVGAVVKASSSLRFDDMAAATVHVRGASSEASKLFIFCSVDDVDFEPLLRDNGEQAFIPLARLTATAVQMVGTTTAEITTCSPRDAAYVLPQSAFSTRCIRLVADAALGPDATVIVSCKS